MSGESMEELLAMFAAEPYTHEQLAADREQLIADFKTKHGLGTWDEIIHAVRTFAIGEDNLVERFIELRAFEQAATHGRCECDYCTGKRNPREWCAHCGAVRLRPDQNGFEDLDVCDTCDALMKAQA